VRAVKLDSPGTSNITHISKSINNFPDSLCNFFFDFRMFYVGTDSFNKLKNLKVENFKR
jgi:hypothetical protein